MRARVGLNLLFLVPGETGGMEVAATQLIGALLAQPREFEFTVFVNQETASNRDWSLRGALPAVTVPVDARSRVRLVLGEQLLLPRLAAGSGVPLLHSLGNTGPLSGRFRRVLTVHDLIYAHFPEAHAWIQDKAVRVLVPASVKRSHRLLAPSQTTRTDLIERLGVAPGRIDVAPWGVDAGERSAIGRAVAPPGEVRRRWRLGARRVLLSLSAKRPHKNLLRLLEAIALIDPDARPVLVAPGYATWHEPELQQRAQSLGIADDVRFLGWVDASELEGLWGAADGFVFPSLYEGFGLPVLEAMARGVPVACSDIPVLREVAGGAALLFDPRDPAALARAVQRLLSDEPTRAQLRARGPARAAQFSWERAAQLTLDCYRRTLGGTGT